MVQINIATPRDFNVRMPSGNEMGANNLWLPGGRLPTGQLEAVVDQIPKGGYTESLLPQAGKNLTPSNAPALNLAPAGHGMKPVTNPPAPATPVKAHTSANQANQGSHPVADPGASPTVKRAINALQEGSPDTRIGKTELQFREAVEGGAKGVGVADTARLGELGPVNRLLYGARVGEGLPGSAGVPIPGRPTAAQLESLTVKHDVEFAVTYQLGPGKGGGGGQYFLFSGEKAAVDIPLRSDSMLIYHSHPGGTPWASSADMNVMRYLEAIGSPQRSSQVVPVGKDVIRFNKETPRF